MIREWLSRRRRAAPGVHRPVDEVTFLGAQFDVRDAQIEGLRDALTDAHRRLAAAQQQIAQLQVAAATALASEWMRQGRATTRRLAEEPTAVVSADQLRRTRPAAPTEQYRRPQ